MKSDLATMAYTYAAIDWKVFPLWWATGPGRCACPQGVDCASPAKHPVTRNGVLDASDDPEQVKRWWARWPYANIGLPAGGNGLAVLDVDPAHGGKDSLRKVFEYFEQRCMWWPDTLIASTGGGGRHYVFIAPEGGGIKNVSACFGPDLPGLDTRGVGGYVVAAPSRHASGRYYEWLDFSTGIAPWPEVLTRLMDWRPKPKAMANKKFTGNTKTEKYAIAALEGEIAKVRAAAVGCRNSTLNEASFNCGTLVGAGLLDEMLARRELLSAALSIGLSEREAIGTIESGLRAGTTSPRQVAA